MSKFNSGPREQMSFQQPQEPITDAKTLYKAVRKVLENPEVTSIQYLWDADDIWAEPDPPPHIKAILQEASRFLRKAVTGCPPAVRTGARWTGAKLSLEPDMDDLFRNRFGISTQDVAALLASPNLLAAEDRTLSEAIERDLQQAKQRVEQDLDSVWDTTREALAPMGFELEDTHQRNLKYAVPGPDARGPLSPPDIYSQTESALNAQTQPEPPGQR